MTREPIERRNVYELVADDVTRAIRDGHLKPGDPIPVERELVDRYQVGRSSVREALRVLESHGLIAGDGRGSFVVADPRMPLRRSLRLLVELDEASLLELAAMRQLLESETAALAARSRKAADLKQLDAAMAAMEANLADEQPFIDADLQFHIAIADATGNRVAGHLMGALREELQLWLSHAFRIPGSPEAALDDHRAIRAAIAERDDAAAREAMRRHLARVEAEFRRKGGKRG
jgi:GntR family transcriptional regulator, transcriptional repressor for pyruvate dehydrogenase complex